MRYVGVDGCRGGWVAVTIEGRAQRFAVLQHFAEIERLDAHRVLVDMPIGLPDSSYRGCDVAARTMLGAGRSRVFLGARRPLLSFATYEAANDWAKADGKGVSVQLWNILRKIAEIDAFVTPARQAWLFEAHPELAFQRLNGGRPLPNKKFPAGRRMRRDLVAQVGFTEIGVWLGELVGTRAGADDLLDACVLAHAAGDPRRVGCAQLADARGLAMDIWY